MEEQTQGCCQATPNPTYRTLSSHKVNPANDKIDIEALDARGSGGANHMYRVSGFTADYPEPTPECGDPGRDDIIRFQNGPIAEYGVNGVTQEVLLAICIDRLECFQSGPYACYENAMALIKLQEAQMWLQKRTRDRMARGVEGTHKQ